MLLREGLTPESCQADSEAAWAASCWALGVCGQLQSTAASVIPDAAVCVERRVPTDGIMLTAPKLLPAIQVADGQLKMAKTSQL